MTHEFRLADIGEGLEEAEIISWLVQVGDQVARDQPLIEIMTDKSNAELPAPVAGTVVALPAAVGDIIQVGELIAVIDPQQAEPSKLPTVQAVTPAAAATVPVVQQASPLPTPAIVSAQRPKASPSTRRVAAERGVDLAAIVGTGPGGRILLSDLDTAAAPPAPTRRAPQPGHEQRVSQGPGTTEPDSPAATAASSSAGPIPVPPPAPPAPLPRSAAESSPTGAPASPPPAPASPPPAPNEPGTVPLRGIRRAIAHTMERSWAEIPHIHALDHVDAEPLLEMRGRLKDTGKEAYAALTPLSFFVAAVAQTLAAYPQGNATIDTSADTITYHSSVNVGIAVAAPQGLVVPVLRGADQLDFDTLSLTLTQLVRGAREGSLAREHFQGGTVTITNFGSLGGEQALPIVRATESMIFGFGLIAPRPFVIEDEVVARKTIHLVVGADHRLLDGDVVTSMLNQVAGSLTDPLRLVL